MRKAHMQVVIDHLRKANADLTTERDLALTKLHQKADATKEAVGKLGTDISDLAATVRAAAHSHPAAAPEPAPAPEASADESPAKAVTPIRRRTKAAG